MGEPNREPEFNADDFASSAARAFDARHAPRPSFPGSELLTAENAREVLARITPGDPLGLGVRCQTRLRERALFVEPNRVLPRAFARSARSAASYRGEPELGAWLAQQIDRALADCMLDDREDERAERPPNDAHYAFVSEAWGISPKLARAACVVFNDLPLVVRRNWWALSVDGKSINRWVAEGHGSPSVVQARAERAILAISLLRDPGGDDPHERDGGTHA